MKGINRLKGTKGGRALLIVFPFLLDLAVFVFLMMMKYIFFFHEIETHTEGALFLTPKGKIYSFISLLTIGFLFYFATSKRRRKGLLFINLFLSLLLYADILYYRYFHDITSFSLLFQVNQVKDVKQTIFGLVKLPDILYFLDNFLLFSFFLFIKKKGKDSKIPSSPTYMRLLYMLCSFTLFSNLYFALDYSGGIEKRNTNVITTCQIGGINFHFIDTYEFVKERITSKKLSADTIEKIASSFPSAVSNQSLPYWGIMKGKNVLFVQMESMSEYVVNKTIEGKEITPNLNRLSKEGYYADNFYSQVGDGHTSDAEFIVLNSIFPLSRGSVSVLYSQNDYQSLPKLLAEQGYYTFSAHGYDKEFWNRINMHKSLGFQESRFADDFDIKERKGFGIVDKDFFMQSVEKMSQLPQPFFSFLITLQNHTPFDGGDKTFNVGNLKGTKMGNYIQSAHEADKAIGVLIEELKKKGLYENTFIVLYGDHDAELEKEEMKRLIPNVTNLDMYQFKKVPFIILSPHKELVKTDSQPLGEIDIMPTVLHLLGADVNPNLMYGRNVFDSNKEKVVGSIYQWYIVGDYIMAKEKNVLQVKHLQTKKEIKATPQMIQLVERLEEQAQNSNLLIKSNAIKEVKKIKEESN